MSPIPRRFRLFLSSACGLTLLAGCASIPGIGQPDDAGSAAGEGAAAASIASTPEQQVLKALADAPAGEAIVTASGIRVVPEPPYAAASGRRCRWVLVTHPGSAPDRRLACSAQAGWYWAPQVMVQGTR